jgi:hypothetical protein
MRPVDGRALVPRRERPQVTTKALILRSVRAANVRHDKSHVHASRRMAAMRGDASAASAHAASSPSASATDVQLTVDPLILFRASAPAKTGRNRVFRACLRGCRPPSVPFGMSPLGRAALRLLPVFLGARTDTSRDTLAQRHRRDCRLRSRLRQRPIDDGRLRRRRKRRRDRIRLRNDKRRGIREPRRLRDGRHIPTDHQKNGNETAHGCTPLPLVCVYVANGFGWTFVGSRDGLSCPGRGAAP